MSILSQHYILRFEISIDNPKIMYVFERQNYFCCIELDIFFREGELFIEMLSHIFSLAILQSQIDIARSLEGEMKSYYKGMLDGLQDIYFSDNKFGLFAQNDLLLRKSLQSIELFIFQALYQEYLPKRSLSQHLQHLKVLILE